MLDSRLSGNDGSDEKSGLKERVFCSTLALQKTIFLLGERQFEYCRHPK
jgi:hypothetical protein